MPRHLISFTLICMHTYTFLCADAHKALELLEEYRRKLSGTENEELREALSKAIVAIRSRLFQALLGELYSHSPLWLCCG